MQTQKYMLVGLAVAIVLMFVLSGCSSNPMTSTETLPSANGDCSQVSYDCDPSDDTGDHCGGYDATPDCDPDKYDEEPATSSYPPDPEV
jgi:hypothetical protein